MAVRYQTLVEEVRELAGLPDSESAVQAAAATVGALGHVLEDDKRRRIQEVLPGNLRGSMAADIARAPGDGRREDQSGFIAEVAGRCHCTTEQARIRARATLSVLAHHEPEVFASLEPPDWFEHLSAIPLPGAGAGAGGGVTSVGDGMPPSMDDDVRRAEPLVLFDGTGLQGWRMCGMGGFDLFDSAIQGRGGLGMLWYAEREFADFTLTLDWRVAHGSDIGGVLVRFPDPGDDPWVALTEGYEIQLCDLGEGAERTGAICGLTAPYVDPPVQEPGAWNHLEVRVRGQSFRVGVNGREVTSFRGERGTSGYIGVQNHDNGSRIQYRDIRVFEVT
jgi:uncharacterized protein (DUF2267 family)